MSRIARGVSALICAFGAACGGPLEGPESVLYDPRSDVYLVSNLHGGGTEKNDQGFISRLSVDGGLAEARWIDGARGEVILHSPKGMALFGDELFVADIDVIRSFDRSTGRPRNAIEVPGARSLNDLAVDSVGTLYVSDSDAERGAVYRLGTDRVPVAVASGPGLGKPNGLVVDGEGVVVASFGGGELYRISAGGARTDLPKPPAGRLDGLVRLDDGMLLISSWEAGAVLCWSPDGGYGTVVEGLTKPADIGFDPRRRQLLIPLIADNEVRIVPLGGEPCRR